MKLLSRNELIDALRARLLEFTDDEHSICEASTRLGIYCHGFAKWTFSELKRRHPTIVRSRPRLTPAELRDLANRWQIARQTVLGTPLACDTQMREARLQTCKGWDEWSFEELASFHRDLTGEKVELRPPASQPAP